MADSIDASDLRFWRQESGKCPICRGAAYSSLGRRGGEAHRSGLGIPAQVVRCHGCHLVYCHPVLKAVGNPYAAYAGEEYFAGHELEAKLENGRKLIAKAEQLLGRKGKLLELGCGRGELLGVAAERGWKVYGVEMTSQFAREAESRGIQIELSPVETSALLEKEGEFDVVYLAAILEHLYDPVACLKRIRRALAPGGFVFIDVPNECSLRTKVGNLYMRLRGRDWAVNLSPTFPPFHVVGFCPNSLRRALLEAEIDVAELQVVRWPNALPSRVGFWSMLEVAGSGMINQLARVMGNGDGIVCWGRKTS